jgi:hypothetical protein
MRFPPIPAVKQVTWWLHNNEYEAPTESSAAAILAAKRAVEIE